MKKQENIHLKEVLCKKEYQSWFCLNKAHSYCSFPFQKWSRQLLFYHAFSITDDKILLSLINFQNFTRSLISTTYKR